MPALQQETSSPRSPHPRLSADGVLMEAARRHHHSGEIAEAERLYRQLLSSPGEAAEASHNMGVLLLQRREPFTALPCFEQAVRLKPGQVQFWVSYAEAQLRAGRLEDSAKTLMDAARRGLRSGQIELLARRIDGISDRQSTFGVHWLSDLRGDFYTRLLTRLHHAIQPNTYLEIGVESGATLALSACASIGIDPQFQFSDTDVVKRMVSKPSLLLYQMPSDDFFARFNPEQLLGAPIDFAFLDGMHRCEYLLRDFLNTERHCRPQSIIALHDCLPLELPMAEREPSPETIDPARRGMWTGDVWRTALLLKRRRPDLRMLVLDAAPTGLVLLSNLDPHSTRIGPNLGPMIEEMLSWSLEEITLAKYYEQIGVEAEIDFRRPGELLARLRGPSLAAGLQAAPKTDVAAAKAEKKGRKQGHRAKSRLSNHPALKDSEPSAFESDKLMELYSSHRYEEAEVFARSLLARFPRSGFAWKALGVMLQKQGRSEEALEAKRESARLLPSDAESQNNLANSLLKLDRFPEAEAAYRGAITLRPEYPEALSGLGITLQKLGRVQEAEALCRRALKLRPVFADASSNLGIILQEAGRLDDAEQACQNALRAEPSHVDAWNNYGIVLQKLNRHAEAEAAHRKAIELKPDYADAYTNLAGGLQMQGKLAEAEACYRRAIELDPRKMHARNNLLFCLSHDVRMTPEGLFAEQLEAGAALESPHLASWRPHANSRDPSRRIRVGFVSGDFRVHAMSHFTEPALRHLASQPSLSLYAYSNYIREDAVTERFRACLPHWEGVVGLSDDEFATRVRADAIDILVDLSGHTGGNRLSVFARKPAPIQIGWIGYLGSSGMRSMDYYLADPFYLPPGEFDQFFTEKLLHLRAIAPFQPSDEAPPVAPLPALGNGYFTFGSLSRMGKMSTEVIALWSKLLHALPTSRMLLGAMSGEGEIATMAGWFAAHGIARERLDFYAERSMADYLELHNRVDLCLDPFPFTGATTTGHALWMGVPTLSLLGRTASGRLGPAMLQHLNLDSFVARSHHDFVTKGLHWARELESLAQLRAGLRDRFLRSPLGQPDDFAQDLASAFRRIWRAWCAESQG